MMSPPLMFLLLYSLLASWIRNSLYSCRVNCQTLIFAVRLMSFSLTHFHFSMLDNCAVYAPTILTLHLIGMKYPGICMIGDDYKVLFNSGQDTMTESQKAVLERVKTSEQTPYKGPRTRSVKLD